ncbi:MAG: MerR family transcriptional regulator [Candidatus Acidiferrales bacterium]
MRTYSTKEAAKLTDIHFITLQRWVSSGKVRPSQKIRQNGFTLWRWTDADVERVRKFKQENYRKGRGRKPKSKR